MTARALAYGNATAVHAHLLQKKKKKKRACDAGGTHKNCGCVRRPLTLMMISVISELLLASESSGCWNMIWF